MLEEPKDLVNDDNFFITKQAKYDNLLTNPENLISPGVQLEQKRSTLRTVQDDLDLLREQYKEKEAGWKQREAILLKKKQMFLHKIDEMSRFTKRTKNKIEKYTKKTEDERVQCKLKSDELVEMAKLIKQLEEKRRSSEAELEQLKMYQYYLENVCKAESSYDEIDKILKRQETLSGANKDLQENMDMNKQAAQQVNQLLKKEQKDGQTIIFELNSTLANRKDELEKLRTARRIKDDEQKNIETKNVQASQQLSQIIMSINNLFKRCQETRRVAPQSLQQEPQSEEERTLSYLDVITNRIHDLIETESALKLNK